MSDKYENPLCKRYASVEMQRIFSDEVKFSTWRKLWIALAESQKELGLLITEQQIAQMKQFAFDINFSVAEQLEKETRHDVMAHIKAFGQQCPSAQPIIHLGATSCYVGDNTDIILHREALFRVKKLLVNTVERLARFAEKHKALACLAYTHFQAAQPTTLGKRAALWIHDLLLDIEQLDFVLQGLKLLGCRGTTGTSASFLSLFEGNHEKVAALEKKIAEKLGFEQVYPVSGQTYSRKVDYYILSVLSGIAQSAYKFSNDIRLLSHLKQVAEPFEKGQVGSSAMAYKQNPMRSERIAALSRYVTVHALNPALTASAQWLERTLDDSANRRMVIPEAFLAVDAILSLYISIVDGLSVYPKVIKQQLSQELPFMATENILMAAVKKGGDRQLLHERIRIHSLAAAKEVKENAAPNDLLKRIVADKTVGLTQKEIEEICTAENLCGRAKEQTEEFLAQVQKMLSQSQNKELLGIEVEINV
ncbi:MAG: adenylosuccinate lyase [Firmicutes bacterium]|nr:adenylosuccinate lyase [Bacillota bacterium]